MNENGRVDELEGRVLAIDAATSRKIDAINDRTDRLEGMLVKVCARLGIQSDAPPAPPITEDIEKLRASDADLSGQLQKVSATAADALVAAQDAKQTQARTWGAIGAAATAVRDGTPELVKTIGKVGAGLTLVGAAAGGLLAFVQQVWAAIHGR
jgi:hypothetical protein